MSSEEDAYKKYEGEFEKLDMKEYLFLAKQFSLYRKAMLEQGFTQEESMTLLEAFSKFIYDMGVEEFIQDKTTQREKMLAEEFFNDLEDDDDEESDFEVDDEEEYE